jgi:superfamily II DNA/RNA helicase
MQMDKHSTDILARLSVAALNDMQKAAYNAICKEKEVVLLAPTGSGKTLGFLLPVLHGLKENKQEVQCLILVPSRELALQTEQVWKKMGTGFKVNSSYGGHLLETETNNLATPPAVLVGTPGRIMDHIVRGSFDAGSINTLVLDEFDKSLSLGFEEEMSFIINKLKHLKKRVLVSATGAVKIPDFTGIYEPVTINFITGDNTTDNLIVKTVISDQKDKVDTLFQLLCYIGEVPTLVFCNHREAVERTSALLTEKGIENAFFHGGMEQMEREQTLMRFRNGSVYFLIATDLAARGLDIPAVKNIIHYHLPSTREEFIHRNGRTARMHATGNAWLLLHREEQLPAYVTEAPGELLLPTDSPIPAAAPWATIYISGGKKDKLNKTDIVGFFSKVGQLAKDELGMIEVKDHLSFAAVKKNKVKELLHKVQNEKMKGKRYKIAVAK